MSSPAASAMYPALAKAEQAKAEQKQTQRSSVKPEWGRSDHPMWSSYEPRSAPGYAIVPGLVKVKR
jgi:hypothetical protein